MKLKRKRNRSRFKGTTYSNYDSPKRKARRNRSRGLESARISLSGGEIGGNNFCSGSFEKYVKRTKLLSKTKLNFDGSSTLEIVPAHNE